MSFAIFTENEGTVLEGNVSIQPSQDIAGQNASLEVLGNIYTNNLTEYNPGFGLHIFNTQNVTGDTSAAVVFMGDLDFKKNCPLKHF